MGALFSYSLASAIVLAILYLVYKALLSSERQPVMNRIIIGIIYAVAITVPLVDPIFSELMKPMPSELMNTAPFGEISVGAPMAVAMGEATGSASTHFPWMRTLLIIYGAGVAVTLGYLIFSIFQLSKIIRKCEIYEYNGNTIAVSPDNGISPFSWLGYIVMSRADFEKENESIIAHESAHIAGMHCIDIILSQIVACFQWFNPAAWLMTEELRTIHEYEADDAVIESGADIRQYQLLLIKKAVGTRFPSPANSLNQSKIKKRITMMYKSRPTSARRLRALALLPAVAAGLFLINTPAIATTLSKTSDTKMFPASDSKVTKNSAIQEIPTAAVPQEDVETVATLMNEAEAPVAKKVSESADNQTKPEAQAATIESKETKDSVPEEVFGYITLTEDTPMEQYEKNKNDDGVYTVTETLPEFPGGQAAFMEFLMKNVKYPEEAQKNKEQGNVVVFFIVTKTGEIKDVSVKRGVSKSLDEEAIRVVKAMPKWIPGKIKGKAVDCTFAVPITFRLK